MINEVLQRDALSRFASGVTVVTALSEDGSIAGLTANAFSSLSLDPPLILVCVGEGSSSRAAFNAAQSFSVHILAEDQKTVAMAFAKSTKNKSDGIPWTLTERGTPMLRDYLVALECERADEFLSGDHAIIIGQIINIKVSNCGRAPMTYYRGKLNSLVIRDT